MKKRKKKLETICHSNIYISNIKITHKLIQTNTFTKQFKTNEQNHRPEPKYS
jgi:hypothetical protein